MNKIVLAYVPVIHQGYIDFFNKYQDLDCYVINRDLAFSYRPLEKDIRAVNPEMIKEFIDTLQIFQQVFIADENTILKIAKSDNEIVMPDEDFSHLLQKKYFSNMEIIYDSIFLRWDKDNAVKKNIINDDHEISRDNFDQRIINLCEEISQKSGDWWRQIGALIVKNKIIILSGYNHHVPNEQMPYINGDPRASFSKGVNLELSTAIHGEAFLIAQAAKKGISLKGTSIYTTTFPCPPCAKLIAYSGIKKLYYNEGYSMLDGESILKSQGVEIIRVA